MARSARKILIFWTVEMNFTSNPDVVRNRPEGTLCCQWTRKRGMTLLELSVVLVILIAVALIVIPSLSVRLDTPAGNSVTPDEIATQSTLAVVRDAMIGEDGVIENLAHKPEALPRSVTDLLVAEPPEYLRKRAPELARYDPLVRTGWRGPYLHPTGKTREGRPTLVDGWGNEIEMQIDFDGDGNIDHEESQFARLVSPGPNGAIETPVDKSKMKPDANEDLQLTLRECGDDIVMFLRVPDFRK
jgi:hypothetical protein